MTHRIRIAAAAVLLAAVACLVPATAVAAPDTYTTDTHTTEPEPAAEAPSIIPRPNRGSEPDDAGDRGGALQAVVFGAILAGVIGIGALIVRESRRSRQDRGA